MCGRYRLTRADRLAETFAAVYGGSEEDLKPRYNIAPSQPVLVVRPLGPGRSVSEMRWGLVPSWAKDPSHGHINARSEALLEKPAFRESFQRRRCLIPADGFYEWKRAGKWKQPFHFGMEDGSLFAFAGIWDCWRSGQGESMESCAIVTTAANHLLRDVHDRMPLILSPESYTQWLSSPASELEKANLWRPFSAQRMKRWPVSAEVNDPANDSPSCMAEVPESAATQAPLF
jgi:putative SOS response-associated peptidase YedK